MFAPARRLAAALLAAAVLVAPFAGPVQAAPNLANLSADQRGTLDSINRYFNSVTTLEGKFIQTGPDGSTAEGYFVIDRPGKMRFRYEPPAPIDIIADGRTVAINDKRLKQQTLVFLNDTPLRFLLTPNLDLTQEAVVKSVSVADELITVMLEDPGTFQTGRLTLIFDGRTTELRQWTITDAQGLDTTVAVYDLQGGKATKPEWFKINYSLYK